MYDFHEQITSMSVQFLGLKKRFCEVMELASIDFSLKIVEALFFFLLLIWVLVETLKQRRGNGDHKQLTEEESGRKSSTVTLFTKTTVLSSSLISISYIGFCLYEFPKHQFIPIESVILAMTWSLATVVAVLSVGRMSREHKRWPTVLILWWVFSVILDSVLISFSLINYFNLIELPKFLPLANIVHIGSFPFSILLCFNALLVGSMKTHTEIEQPLLHDKDAETLSTNWGDDPFSKAGILSQITFMWLNPLFRMGRSQKLEFTHIPSIPQSETADNASCLLEESLQKRKAQSSLLPNAILQAIRRPLAINAIFAGMSVLGTLLIEVFSC